MAASAAPVRIGPQLAGALLGCVVLLPAAACAGVAPRPAAGVNPHPVRLSLPPVQPLSAMAQLGDRLFHDRRLSDSGRLSCASCHDPAQAYGPVGGASVVVGGPDMHTAGFRAVPSLRYLYRQPPFSIGPDSSGDGEQVASLQQQALQAGGRARVLKSASAPRAAALNLVPQGGLFWDGRVNTLQQEADGPMFNPAEMDAGTQARLVAKLRAADYAADFRQLFGTGVFGDTRHAVDEAMFAIGRYQIESRDFHPFSSRYDAWLQGQARLSPAQLRGYRTFNDPSAGNCAACHLDQVGADGLPPLFTDFQYEALGVPRNAAIPANRDPRYYDLGICGPYRTDLREQGGYCGMFLTPTLRNVALRRVFFHNGVFHSLRQVLDWYVNRDLHPARFYPRDSAGRPIRYDDLPAQYRGNVDVTDAPFNRRPGDQAALSAAQIRDIIAFLGTLTDGYSDPGPRGGAGGKLRGPQR
ncbi:MAG TPA: cytochrome c peroxidase [Steroidobacteraceae bacterium]|jgi:cytochrome c peroxidase|nr:cytochrome c peroxidase [Steroidobacteraceae bacterium]